MHTRSIFEEIPTHPSCHAATIVETPWKTLLAAWFAGQYEGSPDVAIWLSRFDGESWSEPHIVADEPDVPLWNPVLFRDDQDIVWLFYKVAPSIPAWTGVYKKSFDGGETWSVPVALPAGLLGPIKNKPITLSNGDILCPTSSESWRSWACWVEISSDAGQTWTKHGPITAPGSTTGDVESEPVSAPWDSLSHELVLPQAMPGLIQPTVWEYAPGRLKMLMRSTKAVGFVGQANSDDYGRTWSLVSLTKVPCPNSGLDAVRLADGRVLLVCNPVHDGRTPLSVLMSEDNGSSWERLLDLEVDPGEYSYPSIIQCVDGHVHIVYTYRRVRIQHAVLVIE